MNEIDKKREERRRGLELVMFPASKNYPESPPQPDKNSTSSHLDDPLEELLNEFSEFEDEFPELIDDEDFQELDELNEELAFRLEREGELEVVFEQLELLRETQQRLKIYLDEIESVLPTR